MIEIDGPQRAWFEDKLGTRYVYTVYAVGHKGESPVEVMQSYAAWRKSYEDATSILVWRARPQLVYDADEITERQTDGALVPNKAPEPFWKVYCRCVKVPIGNHMPMDIKHEGYQVPFMN